MARTDAMADIDTYVAQSQTPPPPPVVPETVDPANAVNAPQVVETASPATSKPDLDTQIKQAKLDALKENQQERASIREMKAVQLEAQRQREEDSRVVQQARQLKEGIQDTTATVSGAIRQLASKASARLASIPIPGDILLPLSILLIFFFALISVNGHTRLSWLWLVLTNNAHIQTGGDATFTGTPPAQTPPPSTTSTAGKDFLPQAATIINNPGIAGFAGNETPL